MHLARLSALLACPVFLLAAPRASQEPAAVVTRPGAAVRSVSICADALRDQDGPGCLFASSVPAPGLLFPPPHDGGLGNVSDGVHSYVGGGRDNTATGSETTVGGGLGNFASGGGAVVGGGVDNRSVNTTTVVAGGSSNHSTGRYSTVSGGLNNRASGQSATVGGGGGTGFLPSLAGNRASGAYATVSGGAGNGATGTGSTVAGGGGYFLGNAALGEQSSIGGGSLNRAENDFATVPGGENNHALGAYSFAAGRRAKALHAGAFVWGDSQFSDKPSSRPDEFNVYASGGVRLFSDANASTGVLLAPGSGTWSAVSDRDAKENFEHIEPREVLERLLAVPITTWNYKSQDNAVRHMGPMAQDFHAAFGLGLGARSIDTIDPDGVALAAIQGLHELVARRDVELAALRTELDAMKATLATLTPAK